MSNEREPLPPTCIYCDDETSGSTVNDAPICDRCQAQMLRSGWWQLPSAMWSALNLGLAKRIAAEDRK